MSPRIEGGKRMTLSGHLEELRSRLIRGALATVVGVVIAFTFVEHIFNFLRKPFDNVVASWTQEMRDRVEIVQIDPAEGFFVSMKVAFFAGIILAAPVLLSQIWGFIAAGLYQHERRVVKYYALPGLFLFFAGAALAYYFVLPFALDFLLTWGLEHVAGRALIRVNSYVQLIAWAMFVFGVVFQLPVVMVFLMRLGVVEPATFRRWRKGVIVGCFAVAMILTPPDVISQLVLAVCMMFLYEVAILIGDQIAKKRDQEERNG